MNKKATISKKREKLNLIHSLIAEYGREDEEKLIRLCIKQGSTIADIARVLEVTPQAIHDRYPDLRKGGKALKDAVDSIWNDKSNEKYQLFEQISYVSRVNKRYFLIETQRH